jgi:protein-tyrosine kinase
MSRDFDLLQELERERASRYKVLVKPLSPFASDDKQSAPRQLEAEDDFIETLVQRIFPRNTRDIPRMVVFAGVDSGNGAGQIASVVAKTLARDSPGAVCLVEANFRSPEPIDFFSVPNERGLAEALLNDDSVRTYVRPVGDDGLWLLPAGTPIRESVDLLTSERMQAISAELRREFDFVIVEAASITGRPDAAAVGQLSDGIVVVLDAESTRRGPAVVAVENLRASNVRILGAVLNKYTYPIPKWLYNKL